MPNEQRDKTKKNNRDVGAVEVRETMKRKNDISYSHGLANDTWKICGANFTGHGRPQITNVILSIIAIIAILTLIIGRINDNKNLDKIIYRAKKEAENTLASTGRMIYAEDVENVVGAIAIARNENLPENTTSTPQGTIVKPKENWNIETVKAISVGNGDTVPVPIGFYYVGGDLNTGVIISDEEGDKYDGETDKTTWEYTTSLKGNQFVWIPCKEEEYKKCEVWNEIIQQPGTLCNTGWDKMTYSSELPQIRKYEGFYVARYEAGLAKTITEFTSTQMQTGSNQVYNVEGIPQSKAGVVPWMFIDWNNSQTNAKNMYNTSSVSSGLITGTMWDVMLNKMVEKGAIGNSDLASSGNWGNYGNNSIEYTGRMARAWVSGSWYQSAFGKLQTSKTTSYGSNNGDLLTTGASKQTEKYHIFDVAGNLWEYTEESSLYKGGTANETNIQYVVFRSGVCTVDGITFPACYRYGGINVNETNLHLGFRVVLYIK